MVFFLYAIFAIYIQVNLNEGLKVVPVIGCQFTIVAGQGIILTRHFSQVVITYSDNYVDMVVEVNLTILLSLTTL